MRSTEGCNGVMNQARPPRKITFESSLSFLSTTLAREDPSPEAHNYDMANRKAA